MDNAASNEIAELEQQIYNLTNKLNGLRKDLVGETVVDYRFKTSTGELSLREMFGDKRQLLVIHNMGQGCRYCTLWADGLNGFLPHLESAMSVFLVSKDEPELQERFAGARGWRFKLASHGGGDYIREQSVMSGEKNMPGAVVYELSGDHITRKNASVFGPGDLFCSIWNLLGMAGFDESNWTPQYQYWTRPKKLDDGGANVLE